MLETYDCLLVLGCQDFEARARQAAYLYNIGVAPRILVCGAQAGFALHDHSVVEAQQIRDRLVALNIGSKDIFTDERPRETLGSFVYPAAKPLQENFSLADMVRIALVTDSGHSARALECARAARLRSQVHCFACEGGSDSCLTIPYHNAMLRQLRHCDTTEKALSFIEQEHPFYSPGWYDDTVSHRQWRMARTVLSWMFRRPKRF
jgi:hypothetical protein